MSGILTEAESKEENPVCTGKVINLTVVPPKEPGNDPMFSFEIGQERFTGFKQAPFLNGDLITFEFKIKGPYKNFVRLINVSETSLEPRPADQLVKETFNFTQKPTDSYLQKKMFTDLLKCAVDFKIAQKDLNEEAIYALHDRLLTRCGLKQDWITLTQITDKGGKK